MPIMSIEEMKEYFKEELNEEHQEMMMNKENNYSYLWMITNDIGIFSDEEKVHEEKANEEKPVNRWTDYMSGEVVQRLRECRSLKDDLPSLVNARWRYMCLKGKDKNGFRKEDALIWVLELLDCNGQFFDLTRDEYFDLFIR